MEITKDFSKRPSQLRGFLYFLNVKRRGYPNWVNIEVTKRCNARCTFCGYWEEKAPKELADYTDVIKKFKPVVVSLSGGEPLIRRDLEDVIRKFRPYCHYVAMVTNGILLNEQRAQKLKEAGVNQISVSLDFLDERHDAVRGVAGLFKRLSDMLPRLAAAGHNIVLNTVIMETNLDQIIPLAHQAAAWGIGVSYSSYCSLKVDDDSHMISDHRFEELAAIIKELKGLKKTLRNIRNSDYYLDFIPEYFKNGGIPGCQAGHKWVQITPDGQLQPCSELKPICHFSEYDPKKVGPIDCTKCWFACRGEAQANPLKWQRLRELMNA